MSNGGRFADVFGDSDCRKTKAGNGQVPLPTRAGLSDIWDEGELMLTRLSKYVLFSVVVRMRVQVFDAVEQTYWRAGKKFGRSLTPERVVDGLAVFFCNGSRMRGEVISATLSQLYRIKAWADRQTRCSTALHCLLENWPLTESLMCRYTFVSASVLIVYDGEPTSLPMSQQDLVRVKLIDFAQTTKATECVNN